jgi:hypothetical protein
MDSREHRDKTKGVSRVQAVRTAKQAGMAGKEKGENDVSLFLDNYMAFYSLARSQLLRARGYHYTDPRRAIERRKGRWNKMHAEIALGQYENSLAATRGMERVLEWEMVNEGRMA